MCIDYDKALDKARKDANKSKDGEMIISGETYFLKFNTHHWHYEITDSNGLFVVNLNVKGLTKAKSEFKKWMDN